jgi:hypothetical protein
VAVANTNLYFRQPAIVAPLRQGWLRLDGLKDPEVLLRRLRERHVGVILLDCTYEEPGREPEMGEVRNALAELARRGSLAVIHEQEPYIIYRMVES